jgi:CBS domain-containing protein
VQRQNGIKVPASSGAGARRYLPLAEVDPKRLAFPVNLALKHPCHAVNIKVINAFVLILIFDFSGGIMLKVKDIMTKEVITVTNETTVEELARLLIKHKISGAPVVDDSGNLTGVVTENDLINQNKRLHIPTIIRLFDAFILLGSGRMEDELKKMAAVTVGEICTRKVVSVNEETSLEDIATLMSEKNIHLLPVVRDRVVVGIVGKADIVSAMVHGTSK